MDTRERILAELDLQAQHEGETDNIVACRIVLRHISTAQEWYMLSSTKHQRYGLLSYQTHKFHYLRPWVVPLAKEIATLVDGQEGSN